MTNYIILHRPTIGAKPCKGIEEYSKVGIKAVCNDDIPESDVCIRWGTTSTLKGRPKVYNRASAIHHTVDKGQFRINIGKLAPPTWGLLSDFFTKYEAGETGPWIVRPRNHQRSEGLYFCKTVGEVLDRAQSLPDFYISKYIDKKAEFRVFVCQGRVVWVIEKVPKDKSDVSWGCVSEGQFKYIGWEDWPLPILQNAVEVMRNTHLDFGAVDVMFSTDGKAYCAEVNTAPFMSPYYQRRTANVFDFMVEGKVPDTLSKPTSEWTWKDYIHPVLTNKVA